MSSDISPKPKDGDFRPFYGDSEGMLPSTASYFSDSTLRFSMQQAERDGDIFDRLLDELGVTVAPELAAAVDERDELDWAATPTP
ncbi:hypothetical protein [Azospirillum doebereinerae]